MKNLAFLLMGCCLLGGDAALAQGVQVLTKEALPSVPPRAIPDPVAVPEAMGATLLAGMGFLVLFRRRRY